jgi:hypothetical protein
MIQMYLQIFKPGCEPHDKFCMVNFASLVVQGHWVTEVTLTSVSVRQANCVPIMAVSVLNNKLYLNCILDFVSC